MMSAAKPYQDILAAYDRLLAAMELAVRQFERRLAKPILMKVAADKDYVRFPKRDIEHAILLKLVMIASGLNAAMLLHRHGHTFEQGALSRMVDEANEDVLFMSFAILNQDFTPRHQQFLDEFWAEEWSDPGEVVRSHQARNGVPRQKISAYLARHEPGGDPSKGHAVRMFLSKAYSGFVHGASPHLMDLYHEGIKHFSVTVCSAGLGMTSGTTCTVAP